MHRGLVLVPAVNHDRAAAMDAVDRLGHKFLGICRFSDDDEPVRATLLEMLPLQAGPDNVFYKAAVLTTTPPTGARPWVSVLQ